VTQISHGSRMLITTPRPLDDLCNAIRATGFCGYDTEFVAEKSYWPRLGLVQLGAPGGPAGAVDPLALDDLSPVVDLLLDPAMTIVVHAGSMDWKILAKETGRLPLRTFDTQIAASFLGYGLQAGYGALVDSVLGRKIDKTETFTDWLKRPLSPEQVAYAVGDVTHLMDLHVALEAALRARGRLEWAQEEFAAATLVADHLDPDERTLYQDFRRVGGLGRKELAVLRELVAWRELEARDRDVRPNFVAKDDVLLAAAKRAPRSEKELGTIRAIAPHELGRIAPGIVKAVHAALALPESEWPELSRQDPAEIGIEPTVNVLQAFVQTRAREADLAPEVVAPRSTLKQLAISGVNATRPDGTPVLTGWRREVLGEELNDLLSGRAAVAIDPATRRVRVVPVR
jgi:ribonuclease D